MMIAMIENGLMDDCSDNVLMNYWVDRECFSG